MSTGMQVILAGTGTMARDIGAFLLDRDRRVAFVGREGASLRRIEKRLRERAGASFHKSGESIPGGDVLIETVAESIDLKRQVVASLVRCLPPDAPFASNSSSILPGAIHPRCIGLHFFHPVEWTSLAELVVPNHASPETVASLRSFATSLGLHVVEQGEPNAFAVNRLLLPLQSRCFEAVLCGCSAVEVDRTSRLGEQPAGQLALMDAVGLDTVKAAVDQYASRMSAESAAAIAPLRDGLATLVATGKLGKKNGDGILCGRPLPWNGTASHGPSAESLRETFELACRQFVRDGEISESDLAAVRTRLFGIGEGGR